MEKLTNVDFVRIKDDLKTLLCELWLYSSTGVGNLRHPCQQWHAEGKLHAGVHFDVITYSYAAC